MRLITLLPTALFAATSYAIEDPTANDPTPAGALWTAKWDTTTLQPFTQHCKNANTYNARIYKLSERMYLLFSTSQLH
jgi:hypothetical protein